MNRKQRADVQTDDLAARAGWMYYLGGMTQSEIASELVVSRQRAQRLIARAVADGLVRVRLDHPVSTCMEYEAKLREKFGLRMARVAPMISGSDDPLLSVASLAAAEIERLMAGDESLVISLGTGRTLRALVGELVEMDRPNHKLVSLIGNANLDGSASIYEVILRMADRTGAQHFPMALPVVATDREEREFYRTLPHVKTVFDLASNCDVTLVGIGEIGQRAPLVVDGFVDTDGMDSLIDDGGVGELVGWVFDSQGHYLTEGTNERVNGVCVTPTDKPVICVVAGRAKYPAILAALKGRLINSLITDEDCAAFLMQADF